MQDCGLSADLGARLHSHGVGRWRFARDAREFVTEMRSVLAGSDVQGRRGVPERALRGGFLLHDVVVLDDVNVGQPETLLRTCTLPLPSPGWMKVRNSVGELKDGK